MLTQVGSAGRAAAGFTNIEGAWGFGLWPLYFVLGAFYFVLGSWYLVLGTLSAGYFVLGTLYLVGIATKHKGQSTKAKAQSPSH